MDAAIKKYIDSLDRRNIPWNRMFTAYGTAENYDQLLSELEQIQDPEQWKKTFNRMSDFEHQSTMFPPAPFALVFLVRILKKLVEGGNADEISKRLIDQLMYYVDVCNDADNMEHAQPLESFKDLLNDENLLPGENIEEELEEIFGDAEAVSDELFYSFYYYSKIVLSQVPGILDECGMFPEESIALRKKYEDYLLD